MTKKIRPLNRVMISKLPFEVALKAKTVTHNMYGRVTRGEIRGPLSNLLADPFANLHTDCADPPHEAKDEDGWIGARSAAKRWLDRGLKTKKTAKVLKKKPSRST